MSKIGEKLIKAAKEARNDIAVRTLDQVVDSLPAKRRAKVRRRSAQLIKAERERQRRRDDTLCAVRKGVHDAFWRMITSATDMPGHDFFDTMKDAIKEAIKESIEEGKLDEQV